MITMPVIAMMARLFDKHYTRTEFENVFYRSGTITENPVTGNKLQTLTGWLKEIRRREPRNAAAIIGRILEDFFEGNPGRGDSLESDRELMRKALAESGIRYARGGTLHSCLIEGPTRSVRALITGRNFPGVLDEFARATSNLETKPRDAASAAANTSNQPVKNILLITTVRSKVQ